MRRYFVMVTPGMATGYWKAMKRPMRARSSGSASVMSSPLKRIEPSVTSSVGLAHDHVGQRRLARAVGAHERVDLALAHGEVEPAQDLLVAGADVQVLDLEVGHGLRCRG